MKNLLEDYGISIDYIGDYINGFQTGIFSVNAKIGTFQEETSRLIEIFSNPNLLQPMITELLAKGIDGLSLVISAEPDQFIELSNQLIDALLHFQAKGGQVSDLVLSLLNKSNLKSAHYHEAAHARENIKLGYGQQSKFVITFSFDQEHKLTVLNIFYMLELGFDSYSWRDLMKVLMAPVEPSEGDYKEALEKIYKQVLQECGALERVRDLQTQKDSSLQIIEAYIDLILYYRERGVQTFTVVEDFINEFNLAGADIDSKLLKGDNLLKLIESLTNELSELLANAIQISTNATKDNLDFSFVLNLIKDEVERALLNFHT